MAKKILQIKIKALALTSIYPGLPGWVHLNHMSSQTQRAFPGWRSGDSGAGESEWCHVWEEFNRLLLVLRGKAQWIKSRGNLLGGQRGFWSPLTACKKQGPQHVIWKVVNSASYLTELRSRFLPEPRDTCAAGDHLDVGLVNPGEGDSAEPAWLPNDRPLRWGMHAVLTHCMWGNLLDGSRKWKHVPLMKWDMQFKNSYFLQCLMGTLLIYSTLQQGCGPCGMSLHTRRGNLGRRHLVDPPHVFCTSPWSSRWMTYFPGPELLGLQGLEMGQSLGSCLSCTCPWGAPLFVQLIFRLLTLLTPGQLPHCLG